MIWTGSQKPAVTNRAVLSRPLDWLNQLEQLAGEQITEKPSDEHISRK
jgi:hypothetical protein